MKILYAEDSRLKYMDVQMALKSAGMAQMTRVQSVEKAVEAAEDARDAGEPYDIVLTDMNYPLREGGRRTTESGTMIIRELREHGFDMPVIICSSHSYNEPLAYGSVFYSERKRDWERELVQMIQQAVRGGK